MINNRSLTAKLTFLVCGLLLALSIVSPPATATPVASITFTQPDGINDVVGEGDDFATRVLDDPWDMSEPTDILYYAGVPGLTISDGILSFTMAEAQTRFSILFQGINGAYSMSRDGTRYPINTDHYRWLSFRMRLSQNSTAYIHWFYDQVYSEFAVSNPIPVYGGDGLWHTYAIDLETYGTDYLSGGATGWDDQLIGLAIQPAFAGGIVVEVDWIRLTANNPVGNAIQIAWSDLDPTGDTLDLYLDKDEAGYDGALIHSVGNALRSGSINWGEATGDVATPSNFLPGDYYLYALIDGEPAGYTPAPLTINAAPILRFTQPSHISGDDYATVELGDAWDMSQDSDVENVINGSYSVEDGLLRVVNSLQDVQVLPNVGPGIDGSKYHYFTYRLLLDYPLGVHDVGQAARLYWGSRSNIVAQSKAHLVYTGWRTYVADLPPLSLDWGTSWQDGSWSIFRLDPNSNITGQPMTSYIDYVMITADPTGRTNSRVPIWYELSEQDNVDVTLYYDTDTNPDNGKTLIDSFHYVSALHLHNGLDDAALAGQPTHDTATTSLPLDFRPAAPNQDTLEVTKHASPSPVQSGAALTYTLCVTNTGSVTLTTTVTDVLPSHVTPTGVLTWTPTITAPNGIWTETVVVTVEMGYAGPLTNVVHVTTEEGPTDVYTHTLAPDLEVTKQANPDSVWAGETLTYTIHVTNTGDFTLHAAITDTLPDHVTPTGVLTWTPTITAPNGVWTEQFTVTAQMSYSGTLANVVRVATVEGAAGIYTETSNALFTPPNQPPYTPSNPIPADCASSVPVTQVLSWQGGDPDGDLVTYTVALGTSDPPSVVATTTLTSYTPTLISDTTCYWGITATDGISTSVGPTWSFTTVVSVPPNQPPYTPSNPIPADGANSVPTTQSLSWQGGDPDGDVVTYTVALGTSDPPPIVATTTLTSYAPTLISDTTYYWGITASDGISTSVGPTWGFTTVGPVYLPLVVRNYVSTDLPHPTGIQEWWDTTGVPAGSYYILAEVSDGYNTTFWYSEVPIILTDD